MNARRGLTLLEILIALAIVLTISAVVVPLSLNELDRRTFDAAADAIEGHLLLARAEAQTAGRAIEVVYDPESRELTAYWFGDPPPGGGIRAGRRTATGAASAAPARSAMRRPATRDDARSGGFNVYDDEREPIAMSWSQRTLPGRVDVDRAPPPSEDDWLFQDGALSSGAMPTGRGATGAMDSPFESAFGPGAMRIAIYMPDGSALVAQPVWLFDDHGRASELTIGAWTGLPQWRERVASPDRLFDEDEREDVDDGQHDSDSGAMPS